MGKFAPNRPAGRRIGISLFVHAWCCRGKEASKAVKTAYPVQIVMSMKLPAVCCWYFLCLSRPPLTTVMMVTIHPCHSIPRFLHPSLHHPSIFPFLPLDRRRRSKSCSSTLLRLPACGFLYPSLMRNTKGEELCTHHTAN